MSLLLVLVLLAVMGAIAVLAAGKGGAMADTPRDRAPGAVLPDGDVSRDDVDHLTFSLAFRGYRMDEVDSTLDRLADQLAERDARIAELERGRADPADKHTGGPPLAGHDLTGPPAAPGHPQEG